MKITGKLLVTQSSFMVVETKVGIFKLSKSDLAINTPLVVGANYSFEITGGKLTAYYAVL
jgi:hypothetical protein